MYKSEQVKEILLNEIKKIEKLQKQVNKSLRKIPEGRLIVSKSNGVIQFFHKTASDQKKGKYISKKNSRLITSLAQKEYDLEFQKELDKQEKQLHQVLKLLPGKELEQVYSHVTEGKKPYVTPYLLSDEEYIKEWLAVPYQPLEYKEEYKKFETERGEMVRSKVEKIIADKLFNMGIPYRYEYPVVVDGWNAVYPDFMVLKVSTREEKYIEFFGMLDDPKYGKRTVEKIQKLARSGIMLGKNMYALFETEQTPFDTKILEMLIKELY